MKFSFPAILYNIGAIFFEEFYEKRVEISFHPNNLKRFMDYI